MRFSAGGVTSQTSGSLPILAIRCPATEICRLREFGMMSQTAVLMLLGLGRAATVSVTPSQTFAGQNHTPGGPASGTLLVNAWGTAPVMTNVVYFKQFVIQQATGAGIIFNWPADDPLIVGNGSAIGELVVMNMNATTPPLFRWWAVWED